MQSILMTTTIAVRLPDDLAAELERHAREVDRKKSYIIRKTTELYLQEYADYLIALERLRDLEDETLTPAELRKRLDLDD